MLARRFTIVCLAITLFGMLFATLVAKASRSARSWETGLAVPCLIEPSTVCLPPSRN